MFKTREEYLVTNTVMVALWQNLAKLMSDKENIKEIVEKKTIWTKQDKY